MASRLAIAGLALALAACHVQAPTPRPSTATRVAALNPSPSPSRTPGASPRPSVVPTPSGPVIQLGGTVRLDPSYLVAHHAGTLAAGPTIAIPLLSDQGGGFISDAGSGLMANNGGSFISDAGSGLVANNGAGFSSGAGSGYRLVAAGQDLLPASGMVVLALSLSDGKPLGRSVLTDQAGGFKVEVPADQQANVRLIARVPAARRDDPLLADARLQYDLLAAPARAASGLAIDEDTAVATRYLRLAISSRMEQFMLRDVDDITDANGLKLIDGLEPALQPFVRTVLGELRAHAAKAHVEQLPSQRLTRLTQQLMDIALAHIDLDAILVFQEPGASPPTAHAVVELVDVLRATRRAAADRLSADPGAFAGKAYVQDAAARRTPPVAPAALLQRASDLSDLIVTEYLGSNEPGKRQQAAAVFEDLGLVPGASYEKRLQLAAGGIVGEITNRFFVDEAGRNEAYAAIDASSGER
ncbi:MAG: hypothetical protein JWM80_2598 [Cyanobacteria bacterium RYN_339]|nr:hypothetical protein [Cyanobacteria bacterium RYN_339]